MYNKIWEGASYLSFIDMKATWIMTTIHDVIHEALLIKPIKKRPGASKEIIIHNDEGNLALPFPQVLNDYNQGIGDCDVHSQFISVYTTARTHQRI